MKSTRNAVYAAIDTERAYQDQKWNPETTTSNGLHSPAEWLVYIEDYVTEAKHIASREADPGANIKVMEIMRKIAGMAVSAMEQNGALSRTIPAKREECWQEALTRVAREDKERR